MLGLLQTVFGFITGSKIIWKVISNYRILSDTSQAVSTVFHNMHNEDRSSPTQPELVALSQALSNVLKTNIIDIPGFDELELVAAVDRFSGSLVTSMTDAKSGKFHKIVLKRTKVIKKETENK